MMKKLLWAILVIVSTLILVMGIFYRNWTLTLIALLITYITRKLDKKVRLSQVYIDKGFKNL